MNKSPSKSLALLAILILAPLFCFASPGSGYEILFFALALAIAFVLAGLILSLVYFTNGRKGARIAAWIFTVPVFLTGLIAGPSKMDESYFLVGVSLIGMLLVCIRSLRDSHRGGFSAAVVTFGVVALSAGGYLLQLIFTMTSPPQQFFYVGYLLDFAAVYLVIQYMLRNMEQKGAGLPDMNVALRHALFIGLCSLAINLVSICVQLSRYNMGLAGLGSALPYQALNLGLCCGAGALAWSTYKGNSNNRGKILDEGGIEF